MVLNANTVARNYAKGFYKFTVKYTDITNKFEAYDLFMYSIKQLFKIESFEYSPEIVKYGESCIKYLRKINGTFKHPENVELSDALVVVELCGVYAVLPDVLSNLSLYNGRVEEVVSYSEDEEDKDESK